MTLQRSRALAAGALVAAMLLLASCGATTNPENDPALAAPATFGEATFDASTWR